MACRCGFLLMKRGHLKHSYSIMFKQKWESNESSNQICMVEWENQQIESERSDENKQRRYSLVCNHVPFIVPLWLQKSLPFSECKSGKRHTSTKCVCLCVLCGLWVCHVNRKFNLIEIGSDKPHVIHIHSKKNSHTFPRELNSCIIRASQRDELVRYPECFIP